MNWTVTQQLQYETDTKQFWTFVPVIEVLKQCNGKVIKKTSHVIIMHVYSSLFSISRLPTNIAVTSTWTPTQCQILKRWVHGACTVVKQNTHNVDQWCVRAIEDLWMSTRSSTTVNSSLQGSHNQIICPSYPMSSSLYFKLTWGTSVIETPLVY